MRWTRFQKEEARRLRMGTASRFSTISRKVPRVRSIIVIPEPVQEENIKQDLGNIKLNREPDPVTLDEFPEGIVDQIGQALPAREWLQLKTLNRDCILAWGGISNVKKLRRAIKNQRVIFGAWRYWIRYKKPQQEAREMNDREDRVNCAVDHYRRYNLRVRADKMSIADIARVWKVHQNEIRESLDLEAWEAQFGSDDEDDIMQQ